MTEAKLTLESIFDAYFDCRKTKRNSLNQLRFEVDLEPNIVNLYYDLIDQRYTIGRSVAFVVTHPKIREVWAADFRDRVVHHVIYRAIFQRYHNRFIRDSYACIPARGTHDGLRRISHFARSITQNWTQPAYCLKIDIANFFNSIDRAILLKSLEKHVHEPWIIDLIRQIILHDPRPTAVFKSPPHVFGKVPSHKSMLLASPGKGLPIGNLTSQFFANVYLNDLDQFVKHVLKARYYGRYVDDMVLMHNDPHVLNEWYQKIDDFLQEKLMLRLHPAKKQLNKIETGIHFVGFVIKPYRTYLRQSTLANCKNKIRSWQCKGAPIDPQSLQKLCPPPWKLNLWSINPAFLITSFCKLIYPIDRFSL